jgi:sulfite exporter TauE/SafE
MDWFDLTLAGSAMLAGLLGSGHCFGMCGGIAAGLGAMTPGKTFVPALQFNLSRLTSYMLLGAVSASILGWVASAAQIGIWLRVLTALMILMIGLRFLFGFGGLDWLERGGSVLWKKIMPFALKGGAREGWAGRVSLGLCWGFLPCGLVYSLLLTAASTGSAIKGASVMLAFGVGTLPSMLGLTMATPALNTLLRDSVVRKVIGFAMVLLAAWSLFMIWMSLQGGMHHHSV